MADDLCADADLLKALRALRVLDAEVVAELHHQAALDRQALAAGPPPDPAAVARAARALDLELPGPP